MQYLEHIIKCSINTAVSLESNILYHACPEILLLNHNEIFFSQLYRNSNFVAQKVQMHSLLHNPTCYKYGTRNSKIC